MRISILLFFCLLNGSLLAQDTLYFDQYFMKKSFTKTQNSRAYFFQSDMALITDMSNGKVVLKSQITGVRTIREINDFLQFIRSLKYGSESRSVYKNYQGHFDFYNNGGMHIKAVFDGKNLKYYSIKDSINNEYLDLGTGVFMDSTSEKAGAQYIVFDDSIMTASFVVRVQQKDTIHFITDKIAEPKEGIPNFYQKLQKKLNYPFLMQLAGEEKKLYIQFIVDKNGKLTEFESKDAREITIFEKKTIRKLSKFPNWNPAEKDGKPVKTRYILPITFALK